MMQFGVGGRSLPMPCALRGEGGGGLWGSSFCHGMGGPARRKCKLVPAQCPNPWTCRPTPKWVTPSDLEPSGPCGTCPTSDVVMGTQ